MDKNGWIRRAKHGDVQAFGEIYKTVYKKLYAYAFYTLKNPQDAEDVVSEAVTDAFASIKSLRNEEAFEQWIYRIVVNKCNRKLREYYEKRREEPEESLDALPECKEAFDTVRIETLELKTALTTLGDQERSILLLHVLFGYKTKEIAAALDLNENTVRSKESRALKKLAQQLRDSK